MVEREAEENDSKEKAKTSGSEVEARTPIPMRTNDLSTE